MKRHQHEPSDDNGKLPGGARRMLTALAQRPQGLSKQQMGVRAGISSTSGTFGVYLGKLRSLGYLNNDGQKIVITSLGVGALGPFEPLPTGGLLFEYWKGQLPGGAARMLEVLGNHYPNALTAEQLAEAAEISSTSGTFGVYLGKLRTLELVQGKRDALKASDEFFEA